MSTPGLTLVCFAVKEEETPFVKRTRGHPAIVARITGMGRRNAERAIREALGIQVIAGSERSGDTPHPASGLPLPSSDEGRGQGEGCQSATAQATCSIKPALVITSGFCGGLDPALKTGDVVFEADEALAIVSQLESAGARRVRFHCAEKVLASVEQKRLAREQTGADAVEMESAVIRSVCREQGIPSATVRVVSDAAGEPLPLDFGALMNADDEMDYLRLAGALARSPGKIAELMRFRRRITAAAEQLARTLAKALAV
jgi:adenosylhomocysteine nucleosidase